MTKLIAVVIVVAVLFGGWEFFLYWERIKNEENVVKKQETSSIVIPEQLPGMAQPLESKLQEAMKSPLTFKAWLKTYGPILQDPRKAWIELDYCVLIAREDPSEARRVFAAVKGRTPPTSPVYPRVKKLENTYR
jgi:hypothetical protein